MNAATRSSVPAVKAQLFGLLPNQPGLVGVQVSYSHPGELLSPEAVYLGEARGPITVPVARSTRVVRQENYTLDVWFSVAEPGSSAQPAEVKAFAFYGELEDLLAVNPTLGNTVISAVPSNFNLQIAFDPRGWAALLKVEISVTARLT